MCEGSSLNCTNTRVKLHSHVNFGSFCISKLFGLGFDIQIFLGVTTNVGSKKKFILNYIQSEGYTLDVWKVSKFGSGQQSVNLSSGLAVSHSELRTWLSGVQVKGGN